MSDPDPAGLDSRVLEWAAWRAGDQDDLTLEPCELEWRFEVERVTDEAKADDDTDDDHAVDNEGGGEGGIAGAGDAGDAGDGDDDTLAREASVPLPPKPHPWELRGFSDLTLVCGDEEINVHRAMVATGARGSRIIRMSLDKPMREAATQRIDLSHLPRTSRCFMSHLHECAWEAPSPHLSAHVACSRLVGLHAWAGER